jgi:predicted TIM-barrel fold metal-dependent hydrolase
VARTKRQIALGALALGILVGASALWYFVLREPAPREALHRVGRTRGFAHIPKIDVHVHVPPAMAETAVDIFARQGVRIALNASGGVPGERLLASRAAAQRTHGALLAYCNFDFSRVEAPDWVEYAQSTLTQCREQGAVGLKIFKALGLGYTLSDGSLLRVDDPRLDVVFERAGELGLPVLIHSGDPQAFFRPPTPDNERYAELSAHPGWSFYGERPDGAGRWPSWQEIYEQFEHRVARHPQTIFVGAHFGNAPEDPDLLERMLNTYPNLMVDTAARVPEIGHHDAARMRRFFIAHADRILFGTDFQISPNGALALGSSGEEPDPPSRIPEFYRATYRYFETADRNFPHPTPIQGDWTIDGIDLPRDVLERIYHRNAERVFHLHAPAR